MDRSARLAFLARANAGRRRLPAFLDHLSHQLGETISPSEVLPLEQGDALRAVIDPILTAAAHGPPPVLSAWSPQAMTALAPHLDAFLRAIATTVYLLPARDVGIGPVRLDSDTVAMHLRALTEAQDEECVVVTQDGRAGLALFYHSGDHEHGDPHPYAMFIY